MRRFGRRNSILIITIFIVVGGILVAPRLLGIGSVPEDDGIWFTTGLYQHGTNETYSVLFHGVNFTFLYYIYYGYLDSPFPVLFEVEFSDRAVEVLSLYIGGWSIVDRVNFTEHTDPRAAIFNFDTHEQHYSWSYAVAIS
ncbi:MAG: hypothetical protein RTU30_08070 [Candidatus Thorarchaeota archaeon]